MTDLEFGHIITETTFEEFVSDIEHIRLNSEDFEQIYPKYEKGTRESNSFENRLSKIDGKTVETLLICAEPKFVRNHLLEFVSNNSILKDNLRLVTSEVFDPYKIMRSRIKNSIEVMGQSDGYPNRSFNYQLLGASAVLSVVIEMFLTSYMEKDSIKNRHVRHKIGEAILAYLDPLNSFENLKKVNNITTKSELSSEDSSLHIVLSMSDILTKIMLNRELKNKIRELSIHEDNIELINHLHVVKKMTNPDNPRQRLLSDLYHI